jgi:putative ABC transport system permease protein
VRAVATVVRAAVLRRRLQSFVVGLVLLLSTGTAVLAVGLLVVSDAPFDRAFTRQSGAHVTATFDGRVAAGDLTATADRAGVAAAAGPFDTVDVRMYPSGERPPPEGLGMTSEVVGRADPGGPVDRLTLDSGTWLTGPGQIVLNRTQLGPRDRIGSMTVGLPGAPTLRVVGVAYSVTGTADAWVWPTQDDVLHNGPDGAAAATARQMLYRFDSAGTDAAVRDGLAAATAGLPAGSLRGEASYLAAKRAVDSDAAVVVPFVVAFAALGLVMSALIVANVVSGAVVAGRRATGIVTALGFTGGQVVAMYAGQVLGPGLVGCLLGVPLGNALAVPLLGQAQQAYGVEASAILPLWVDVAVVLVLLAVAAAAALAPAWRAGRLSPASAISIGRAPRTGRGYRVRRWLAATRLPRAVSFGLGTPFGRPARSLATLLAIVIGAAAVVFATGLSGSLTQVVAAFGRTAEVPVEVALGRVGPEPNGPGPAGPEPNGPGPAARPAGAEPPADPAAVRAVVEAQPATARVAGIWQVELGLPGLAEPVEILGYDTDPTWTGYRLIAGRWHSGAGEVVAGSRLLRTTGHTVGDSLTLSAGGKSRPVRVVGEVFANANEGYGLLAEPALVAGLSTKTGPDRFEIGLAPGTDPQSYVDALGSALAGMPAVAIVRDDSNETIALMLALVGTLTLLVAAVAALGVFNTVLLNTREQVYEIGVLKSVGMTPRQVRTMVVASMTGVGLLAGAFAVPLGFALHRGTLPVMAAAAGTAVPASVREVYHPATLAALALAGAVLAVLGALVPAGWAAGTAPAAALRAE